ncbi:MAG TPA: hypothetical protein VFM29_01165 [Vicinamibacteria bacterium]|nr:hypothetical protein [Vicinamibacteria bacterium]
MTPPETSLPEGGDRREGAHLLGGLALAVFGARCAWAATAAGYVPTFDARLWPVSLGAGLAALALGFRRGP